MTFKMAYIVFILCGIFTVIGSARIGEMCSPSSILPCSTENGYCDNVTNTCTCLYGDFVALQDYCCLKQAALYIPVSSDANFRFTITIPTQWTSTTTLRVLDKDDGFVFQVRYRTTGAIDIEDFRDDVTFTGDEATGDISFTLQNVQLASNGLYIFKRTTGVFIETQCTALYSLGTPTTPSINVNPQNPDVGGSVTLTCIGSTSTTQPTGQGLAMIFTWTFDGATNPTNSRYSYSSSKHQLTISNVVSGDANKQFICRSTENVAGGLASSISNTASFNVYYGPDNIGFNPSRTTIEQNEGTTFTPVTCTVDCYPSCTYVWTKTGYSGQIGTGQVLDLGSLESSEAGVYRCTTTNPGRNGRPGYIATKDLTVNVFYGPDYVSCNPSETSITQNEGTVVSNITCVSDCYPDCTYTWSKSGTARTVDTDGTLSLGQLTRSEAGTYTVTAVNPDRTNSPQRQWSVTINVRYGPDTANINHRPTYSVTEGFSSDNLICTSDCYPSCSNVWRNLSSNSNVGSNGVISFVNVPRYYAGDYRCTSSNTAPQFTKSALAFSKLIVNYIPDVTVQLSSQDWNENSSLRVTCDAEGVPSTYKYSPILQTFGGVSVPNINSNPPSSNILTISSLQLQDTGTYTCTVNNGIADTTGSIYKQATKYIRVKVKPKVLDITLRFVGALRNHVNISIPYYSYPIFTNMEIKKQQDGSTLVNDDRHHVTHQPETVTTTFYGTDVRLEGQVAVLTITNIQEEDFIAYLLVITNAIGSTESIFTLRVESIPSPPKIFVFNGLENGKPSFLWEKDFNGGHTQYFTIKIGSSKGAADFLEKLRMYENTTQYILSNGTFSASIDALSPGTYYAELSTGNKIGDIPDNMALTLTFEIPNTVDGGDKIGSSYVAAVVGAACGGFVLAIVLVIVFVLVKRLRKRSSDGMNVCCISPKVPNRKKNTDHVYDNDMNNPSQQNEDGYADVDGGNSYYNIRNDTENTQQGRHLSEGQYEMSITAGKDAVTESSTDQRSQYECLNIQTANVAVYEMLKQSDTNEVEPTAYENLNITT